MTPSLRLGVWGSFTTPRTRGLGDPSGFTRAGPWCCSDLPCREHPCLPEAKKRGTNACHTGKKKGTRRFLSLALKLAVELVHNIFLRPRFQHKGYKRSNNSVCTTTDQYTVIQL
ncbi:hypothetical protein N032_27910 (plasmid) [Pseudomonas syringae pv. pisi str. PP1]|nr:hypothetical protein N032_27910 [Pseudomonas syringae pv. pisi str. PP1]